MLVAGYTLRVSYDTLEKIGPFHAEVIATGALKRIPHQTGEMLAVYYDYESDYKGAYTLLYGHEVTERFDPPEGMTLIEIPDQEYKTFPIHGPMPMALIEKWGEIWKMDIPRSYTFDMERYKKDVPEILIAVDR